MIAVAAEGITKRFGAFTALDNVDFHAVRGELQAVVGENGAGKTTLMRILRGGLAPDAGTLHIEGGPVGMVSQHYAIIPELSCLDNLMLGAEAGPFIDPRRAASRADELAAQMGFSFDWSSPARTLSPAGAQKLEILKLLWRQARILILDEPTSMLSPADTESLYASLRQLAAEGACVIVVTHRLPEVMSHCREVTVLRGGRLVAAEEVSRITSAQLAELIVGRSISPAPPGEATPGSALIEAEALNIRGHRGDMAVKQASFRVREGEIVGIAGVDGSGQRELFAALMGTQHPESGALRVLGAQNASPADRLRAGLRMVPEDRLEQGLIEEWSIAQNAMLGLQRLPRFRSGPFVNSAARDAFAAEAASLFEAKIGSLGQPAATLSGGNQQRIVAGRALASEPRLILAFQPARGLDIAGVDAVHQEITRQCRQNGAGALVVSFDLDELLERCDRILVMSRGRLASPPAGFERDRAAIGRLMVEAA